MYLHRSLLFTMEHYAFHRATHMWYVLAHKLVLTDEEKSGNVSVYDFSKAYHIVVILQLKNFLIIFKEVSKRCSCNALWKQAIPDCNRKSNSVG